MRVPGGGRGSRGMSAGAVRSRPPPPPERRQHRSMQYGPSGTGPIAASIHGEGGNDNLTLNGNGAVYGEDGNDTLSLRNSFRGEAYGGPGDDYVSVAGNTIEAQLEGNDGNDIMWALDNNYPV